MAPLPKLHETQPYKVKVILDTLAPANVVSVELICALSKIEG